MRRNDRLFDLMSSLGDHGLHRAEDLAARHGVSLRTLYRDIARLQAAGLPVTGTRGAGYRLAPALTLPPLTLTENEVEALQLGLAIVLQSPDSELRAHAETLAAKIDAALPETTAPDAATWDSIPNPFADPAGGLAHLPSLRAAIKARQKLRLLYNAPGATLQSHIIHPQSLDHHARTWLVTGWSQTARSTQTFRVDLIAATEALPELF